MIKIRGRNGVSAAESQSPPKYPRFTFRTSFIGVANWLMPLAIRETVMARDTIYLGLHPDATCGIEPWLGEFELPPPPFPGTFDARFVSTANQACGIGEGLRVNLLPFVTYTQVDTYRVRFQPGTGGYPIVLSWDRSFINSVCDSMVVRDEFGGSAVYARMDITGSVSVANSSLTSLLLVKYGAFPLINDVRPPAPATPPVFSGTRIRIETFCDFLRIGVSLSEFLDEFPSITRDQALEVYDLVAQQYSIDQIKALVDSPQTYLEQGSSGRVQATA